MTTKEQKQIAASLMEVELASKGIEGLYGGKKGHGFWLKGVINPRTNTTWHSFKECQKLIA